MARQSALVIGAGIAGIATAHYLSLWPEIGRITIVDRGQPMAFTSARSGENYRNWWPHPVMTAFTDLSISLMEEIDCTTAGGIGMSRRGYALATRRTDIGELVDALHDGYADAATDALRFHGPGDATAYVPPDSAQWRTAPDGVDIITDRNLIRRTYPSYDPEVAAVIHVRRAGGVDSSRLGRRMLEMARGRGAERVTGTVEAVARSAGGFEVEVATAEGSRRLAADLVFNAAGPFVAEIGRMIGYELPVRNVRQQKIAFEDRERAIPRGMPFSIDLDGQEIDWGDDDRAVMLEDDAAAWLAGPMPGGIHCKPEGAERGRWVKLGWAYTTDPTTPCWEPELDERFPEVVLHGAARLNPALKVYYERLPRPISHYGGYYTMTKENWPLVGPAGPHGSFVVGALSGFGTMAACAAGYLAAALATGAEVPGYAGLLGLARYDDPEFVADLETIAHRSVL